MARNKIDELYERTRVFPRGRNSEDHPKPNNPARYDASPRDGALRRNTPQDIEDQHDNTGGRYFNDVDIKSWLRNGRAESKPAYDRGNAYRTGRDTGMRDQIKYHADADSNRHHTQYAVQHNAGTTHISGEGRKFAERHVPNYEKKGELGVHDSDRPKHTGGWLKGKQ